MPILSYPSPKIEVPGRCLHTPWRGRHLAGGIDMPKGIYPRKPRSVCSIPDCDELAKIRGMCRRHDYAQTKWGDPHACDLTTSRPIPYDSPEYLRITKARLLAKVDKREDGCWIWTGATARGGYGCVGFQGRTAAAHRTSFYLFTGRQLSPIELLHHLCHNKRCVNPEHLEVVSAREHWKQHEAVHRRKYARMRKQRRRAT